MKLRTALVTLALLGGGTALAQGTASQQRSSNQAAAPTCPCCGGQMQGGCGCMHGQGGAMMPGHGMSGGMMQGASCGMPRADVAVEDTPDGVTVRMTAKDPADVAKLRDHARHMQECMSGQGAPAK